VKSPDSTEVGDIDVSKLLVLGFVLVSCSTLYIERLQLLASVSSAKVLVTSRRDVKDLSYLLVLRGVTSVRSVSALIR
jgi:hypothetical protein